LTDTELVEKCKKMFNKNEDSVDNAIKRNKVFISILIIATFGFVLLGVFLYKHHIISNLANKLSPKLAELS
jgi:hypothetical protein